jgi:putative ABC transport system substrate-binding protein
MRRREFITLLGGAAIFARPLAVRAQPAGKLPTIGFLGTAAPQTWGPWVAAFVEQLRRHGWVESQTVVIEYRWAAGNPERYAEFAAEFVKLNVDVIVTGGASAPAVKRATATIPVVFAIAPDPVGSGLVSSLARPGGNITGLSFQSTDLASKRVEILREMVPQLSRLAILGNPANPSGGVALEMREVGAAAQKLGLESTPVEIRRAEDIATAFDTMKARAQALYVCVDPLTNTNQVQISRLALDNSLPSMFGAREYVVSGGLMSYGPDFSEFFSRAADFVDKILRGAKPGGIPVEQANKFELVVNLKTTKALGLNVPQALLALADEVIE